VLDDVAPELLQQQYVDAILGAYSDAGIRARVSILHETKPWTTSVAFLARHLSTAQRQLLEATTGTADADHVARLYEATASQWQGHARVGPVVSPSALQRVSDEHLTRLYDIAERFDLPFHVHIQETFTQALDGPGRYGTSMIAHASSLGILSDRTSVAHGIWLTDDDIDILARTRATVIHNPASNLKLGSGVARVKELLSASVNVGLGCDGYTCNDAQDLIEAMKLASLLSSVASEDPQLWIGPEDALRMATQGGATAVGLRGHGRIVPGVAADLVIFNAETPALRPMNAPAGQLVYCAKRSDVRSVVVDGHLVVADGVVQALDETALLDEIEAVNSRFWRGARRSFDENRMLEPAFAAAYADAQARIAEISNLRLIEGDRPRMLRV
jgi:guanine deaminase